MGRTQQGNNNSYCQDNDISWMNWKPDQGQQDLLNFTRYIIRLLHRHPVLHRRNFFQGRRIRGSDVKDLSWFRPDGVEMTDDDWGDDTIRCFGLRLTGDAIDEVDARGNRIVGDTLLLLLNGHYEPMLFVLPGDITSSPWELLLDTRMATGRRRLPLLPGKSAFDLDARALALFRLYPSE